MLAGVTGMLGLGGAGPVGGAAKYGGDASASASAKSDVSTVTGDQMSYGGAIGEFNNNVAFPGARLSATGNDVNSPFNLSDLGKHVGIIFAVVLGFIILQKILNR